MTSKEALNNIRDYNTELIHEIGSEYNENPLEEECNIIEKDLEMLEEIRNTYKVEHEGEHYWLINGKKLYMISKKEFDKWSRWLEND